MSAGGRACSPAHDEVGLAGLDHALGLDAPGAWQTPEKRWPDRARLILSPLAERTTSLLACSSLGGVHAGAPDSELKSQPARASCASANGEPPACGVQTFTTIGAGSLASTSCACSARAGDGTSRSTSGLRSASSLRGSSRA